MEEGLLAPGILLVMAFSMKTVFPRLPPLIPIPVLRLTHTTKQFLVLRVLQTTCDL